MGLTGPRAAPDRFRPPLGQKRRQKRISPLDIHCRR